MKQPFKNQHNRHFLLISIFAIFFLCFSLIVPVKVLGETKPTIVNSFGITEQTDKLYKVIIKNQKNGKKDELVNGAVYSIRQISGRYNPKTGTSDPAADELKKALQITIDKEKLLVDPIQPGSALQDKIGIAYYVLDKAQGDEPGYLELLLPEGKYELREEKPAPGYLPMGTKPNGEGENVKSIIFNLPMTNAEGTGWLEEVLIEPKAFPINGGVTLTLMDHDTGKALPGASYRLYKKKAGADDNWSALTGELIKTYGELKTDADGKIRIAVDKGGQINAGQALPAGEYKLIEYQAPDGYVLSRDEIKFTIEEKNNGQNQELTAKNYHELTASKFINEEKGVSGEPLHTKAEEALLSKRNSDLTYRVVLQIPADLPQYRVLKLTDKIAPELDADSSSIKITTESADKDISSLFDVELTGTGTTDKQLQITAKTGYTGDSGLTLSNQSQHESWQQGLNGAKQIQITFSAKFKVDPDTGMVKTDANAPEKEQVIANHVEVEYGAPLSAYDINAAQQATTSSADEVIPGKTKGAGTTDRTVTSNDVFVRAENGRLRLEKIDGDDKGSAKKLAGVVFDLYDKDPDKNSGVKPLRKDLITDQTGLLAIDHLDLGTYYLRETKTNAGYILPVSVIDVAVDTNDQVKEVQIKNFKQTNFPGTGTTAILGYGLAGVIVLSSAMLLKHKKRKNACN